MKKRKIQTPFFVVNPKAYLYGEAVLALAKEADRLAEEHDLAIFFTAQLVDLPLLRRETRHLILTAQHMDALSPGRGMGYILPDALANAGVRAVILNHAEHPMPLAELAKAVEIAKGLGMYTLVCAGTEEEARSVALLGPDIVICEPTSLIGGGQISGWEYIEKTNRAVKETNSDVLVLQAAGISTGEDVYQVLLWGADGTGATSGIVTKSDPIQALNEMIQAVVRARDERQKEMGG